MISHDITLMGQVRAQRKADQAQINENFAEAANRVAYRLAPYIFTSAFWIGVISLLWGKP